MVLTVKLFATFREGRFDVRRREYAEGTTVARVISDLGLQEKASIIFVNNRHGSSDSVLEDGDTLALFPPIGGG